MNIKSQIYKVILGIASLYCVYACNDNDTETTYSSGSSDGQIYSFTVTSTPVTARDTITYPYLKSTFFTILSSQIEGYKIFNVDSLPTRTDINTLHVTLAYTATPSAVQLYYLNENRTDSIVEWNTTDSVRFIYDDLTSVYYPKFNVVSPNGLFKRLYTVNFNIHKVNPDSIIWSKPLSVGGAIFKLPKAGESKVVTSADGTTLYALIKSGSNVNFYSSSATNLFWQSLVASSLPSTVLIKSLLLENGVFTLLTSDGLVYTAHEANYADWTLVSSSVKFGSVIGLLPVKEGETANEYLVTYYNADNKLAFGKTTDFIAIEDAHIAGVSTNLVNTNFPIRSYSKITKEIDGADYIVLTGGYSSENSMLDLSWYITSNKLVSSNPDVDDHVVVLPGERTSVLPFASGITTFVYNDSIQAFSADSLRLYTSAIGSIWDNVSENNVLLNDFAGMNIPSIIVDQQNYIWVFGGETSTISKTYSQQIWRGRMNKLNPKTSK